MDLSEVTTIFNFAGVNVYAFGFCCALGAFAGLIIIAVLSHRAVCPKGTAVTTGFFSILLGFITGRLFFCLMNQELGTIMPLKSWFRVDGGGFSMIGVVIGGILASLISARIVRQKTGRILDFISCALLAFAVFERFGERFVSDFDISRPLETNLFKGTFLSYEGEYDTYLATYYLQSLVALILLIVMIIDGNRNNWTGETFILLLILYGAALVILESLRYDRHLSVTFVGLQHVLAGCMMAAGVFISAIREWHYERGLSIAAIIIMVIAAGGTVAIEFAIDRTDFNRAVLYLFMTLLISVPAVIGILLRRRFIRRTKFACD